MSANWSFVGMYCNTTVPASTACRTKWIFKSKCLTLLWFPWAFAMWMQPWLSSINRVGSLSSFPNSSCSMRWWMTSCTTLVQAMYSASVLLRATVGCSLEFQLIAAPASITMYPVVDLIVSRSPPQFESAQEVNLFHQDLDHDTCLVSLMTWTFEFPSLLYVIFISFVQCKYFRTLNAAFHAFKLGYWENLASVWTAKVMSGLVLPDMYNKHPIKAL